MLNASQTLRDFAGDNLNLHMFGALGDGVTDDASAIQSAINAAPHNGKLYCPAGIYLCSTGFLIQKPIILYGAFRNTLFKFAGYTGNPFPFFWLRSAPDSDTVDTPGVRSGWNGNYAQNQYLRTFTGSVSRGQRVFSGLSSVAGLSAGTNIYMMFGQETYDYSVNHLSMWNVVESVNGDEITVRMPTPEDIPPFPPVTDRTPEVLTHKVMTFSSIMEGAEVRDLSLEWDPSFNQDTCIYWEFARNCSVRNIYVPHTRGPVILFTQCDNIHAQNIHVKRCFYEAGKAVGIISGWAHRSCSVKNYYVEDTDHNAVYTEGQVRDFTLEDVTVRQGSASTTAASGMHFLGNSRRVSVKNYTYAGNADAGSVARPITVGEESEVRTENVAIRSMGPNAYMHLRNHYGSLEYRGTTYRERTRYSKQFAITPNMGAARVDLPDGLTCDVKIWLSTKTGISSLALACGYGASAANWGVYSPSIIDWLPPAQTLGRIGPGDQPGQDYFACIGDVYSWNNAPFNRRIVISSSSNVPVGVYGRIEIEYYPLPKEQENFLSSTEEFEDWAQEAITTTADQEVAPDGRALADLLVPTVISAMHEAQMTIVRGPYSTPNYCGGYNFSVHAKAAGYDWAYLTVRMNAGAVKRAWFDLMNGVVGTLDAGLTSAIESLGNSWYRISISCYASASMDAVAVASCPADNTWSFAGNGSSGVYFWGAQLTYHHQVQRYKANFGEFLLAADSGVKGQIQDGEALTRTDLLQIGSAKQDHGAAAPSTGYHFVGERRYSSLTAEGSPRGWDCIVAGTPGTWAPFAPSMVIHVMRDMPVIIGDYVEIGNFSQPRSDYSLDISLLVHANSIEVTKRWILSVGAGYSNATWYRILPAAESMYTGEDPADFDLDYYRDGVTAYFRVRRTRGSLAAPGEICIQQLGRTLTTFTPTSGTGSASAPSNTISFFPPAHVLSGTHAARPSATNYAQGTLYWETNRTVWYVVQGGAWVYAGGTFHGGTAPTDLVHPNDLGFQFCDTTTGILKRGVERYAGGIYSVYLAYVSGIEYGDFSGAPSTLGAEDVGYLYNANDRGSLYRWSGSAWIWKSGNGMSGALSVMPSLTANDAGLPYQTTDYGWRYTWTGAGWSCPEHGAGQLSAWGPVTPDTNQWALCDGGSVTISTASGGTTSVETPDMREADGEGVAVMGGAYSGTPLAATAPSWGETAATEPAATDISIDAHTTAGDTAITGAGTRVTTAGHNVVDSNHFHALAGTAAVINAPSEAAGGLARRIAVPWYMRR